MQTIGRIPFSWSSYAMARAIFALIIGILLFTWKHYSFSTSGIFFTMVAIFLVLLFFSQKKGLLFWKGVFTTCFFIVLGYFIAQHHVLKNKNNHFYHFGDKIRYYEAIIDEDIEVKNKYLKTFLKVTRVKDSISWYDVEGKLIAYLPLEDSTLLNYGDKLLVSGSPELVSIQRNPEEFAFDQYLAYQGVYHQDFIQKYDYQKIGEGYGNFIFKYSYRIAAYCRNVFFRYIHGERERAVLLALVLGIKDELDRDTLKLFSSTGAMHILAVSGLHVGIIFKVLEILFSSFRNHKRRKYIFYLSVFLFLWMYAFITGLSPSVMRAVMMFSFVLLGKAIARKGNIYNTLASSAFVLLCINPFLLFSVGFQLSYFAVLGIVYLQPKIERIWQAPTIYLHYLWQIVTVSLAAQIATFPLGILYFHQFPNYFLITNLIAIPLAGLILQFGVGLIFINSIWQISLTNYIAIFIAYLLEKMIWLMNETLYFIQYLPLSVSEGLYLTTWQTILIYASMIIMAIGWQSRKIYFVYCAKCMIIFLLLFKTLELYLHSSQKLFIIFHTTKHAAILFADGFHATLLHESSHKEEVEVFLDRLKSFFAKYHLSVDNSVNIALLKKEAYQVIVFNGKKIIWITESAEISPLKVDYVVISNNAQKHEKFSGWELKKVILDGTNSSSFVKKWLKNEDSGNFSVYSTALKGAFIEK